jgi:hypothetical protein
MVPTRWPVLSHASPVGRRCGTWLAVPGSVIRSILCSRICRSGSGRVPLRSTCAPDDGGDTPPSTSSGWVCCRRYPPRSPGWPTGRTRRGGAGRGSGRGLADAGALEGREKLRLRRAARSVSPRLARRGAVGRVEKSVGRRPALEPATLSRMRSRASSGGATRMDLWTRGISKANAIATFTPT